MNDYDALIERAIDIDRQMRELNEAIRQLWQQHPTIRTALHNAYQLSGSTLLRRVASELTEARREAGG